MKNPGDRAVEVQVSAAFDDVKVSKAVTAQPGETMVTFTPAEFPALAVQHPRLWWPNGYGEPALHKLHLTATVDGADVRPRRHPLRHARDQL